MLGRLTACLVALGLAHAGSASAQGQPYWAFESGHVRPLALSADRTRLYSVNTPDNRLETFAVSDSGLSHLWSTPTGLEPVAVCLEPSGARAWVVNHLSDDVSVVDLSVSPPRVVRTLLVGDEPMDCVTASGRMFISTARRGQNTNIDPAYLTPAGSGPNFRTPGRALVWVFDPTNLGATLTGTPIEVVGDGNWADGDSIFGDSPRPLAVSPDGSRVYVGIHHSGNRTSAILEEMASNFVFVMPTPNQPTINFQGAPRPAVGAIVQRNTSTGQWTDDAGRNFTASMRVGLPDLDVFEIDAASPSPSGVRVLQSFAGVGTVLFNMTVNPVSGMLYVSNTEANNRQRFEGPGTFCSTQNPPCGSLRGHLHEARITLIDPGTAAIGPRHVNKHLEPYTPATDLPADRDRSLATPLGMAVTADGQRLYVAAFGSRKVGVFDTGDLGGDSFVPSQADQIELSVGGPSGIALDEPRQRLYVSARLGHALVVVDTSVYPGTEIAVVPLPHDPEPQAIRDGKPLLYDARVSSSNGEVSCSSCHVFGNLDSLAWNLGNPDGVVIPNPNPFVPGNPPVLGLTLHPMKGPMLTQSLRGLTGNGPMHLRGDRTGGNAVPPQDPMSEFEALMAFNVAYEGLLGRATPATPAEMMAFTNFALELRYPPNPYRDLSNADVSHGWPGNEAGTDLSAGRDIYFGTSDPDGLGGLPPDGTDNFVAGGAVCVSCHMLAEPAGMFGTSGLTSFVGETQHFKTSHLRNIYARTGFFGMACVGALPKPAPGPGGNPCTNGLNFGDQVRGFGLLHDGAIATALDFAGAQIFRYQGSVAQQNVKRRAIAEFMLGFPTDLRPIVGQQITLDATNAGVVGPRIDLLINRALAGDCDVVVKGQIGGEPRGWVMSPLGVFDSDRASEPAADDASLRALAGTPGQELTYSCVPPGSGPRLGIDRDLDAIRDAQECGDVNGDGVAATGDPDAIRRALADLTPALTTATRCNVSGPADPADPDMDGRPTDCDLLDLVVLRRALAAPALAPGLAQACAATVCPEGPGVCGCGVPVVDGDGDGTPNCTDGCASDPTKVAPGVCGCGVSDVDTDGDATPDCNDLCAADPAKTAPGVCGCGVVESTTDTDGDATPDCIDECASDPAKTQPGVCGCGISDVDTDGDGTADCLDLCPADPLKIAVGQCGCGIADTDTDGDGTADCNDQCMNDPAKLVPGVCGCGVSDVDTDGDGTADCLDLCPADPLKFALGQCGCGIVDTDGDGDGTADCNDQCAADPAKIVPGVCGCGVSEADTDGDGTADCNDQCMNDPAKLVPGVCGCGVSDVDSDGDGTADCLDLCPADPLKIAVGQCGCGIADTDGDGDGTADCNDQCAADPAKTAPGQCGCGIVDTDGDGDGTADCNDLCVADPAKVAPGVCGCGVPDADTDGDGTPDCNDLCAADPAKVAPGVCGCGVSDADTDGDGTADCNDLCVSDPAKTSPGVCGCGVVESTTDSDGDGTPDCVDQCASDPAKIQPGICGCGVSDADTDGDGTPDCNDLCTADPAKTAPGQCGCGIVDTDGDGDGTADCNDLCPADPAKTAPGDCGCGVPETPGCI